MTRINEIRIGEHDVLSWLKPDTFFGALAYLVIFVAIAVLLSRGLRSAVRGARITGRD